MINQTKPRVPWLLLQLHHNQSRVVIEIERHQQVSNSFLFVSYSLRIVVVVLFPSVGISPVRTSSPSPAGHRASSPAKEGDGPAVDHLHHGHVKRNAKGGVLVTHDDIAAAFQMLDSEGTGQITLASLKRRLGSFFPNMTAKEYRFLMNNKKEMTMDDLKDLLIDNEVTHFDPIYDAFRVFDPKDTGFIDEDKLRQAFIAFGLGELSDEELEILKRTADIDGDGMINVEDFRGLLDGATARKTLMHSLVKAANAHNQSVVR